MKGQKNNQGRDIRADLVSRPNAMNGRYKACGIGLDQRSVLEIKDTEIFFLQTLQMKADLADKIIAQAEAEGKDVNNSTIMKVLGEQINSVATPLHRSESVMTGVFASLHLIVYYGVAAGIWGLIFKNFLVFVLCGVVVAILISSFSVFPVIASQRTREKVKEISFAVGAIWGNIAIVIGIIGLGVLLVSFMLN